MEDSGKPNGSSHGNGTSEALSRIARLISDNDDERPTGPDEGEGHTDSPAGNQDNASPELGEIVSDELLEALPAGLAVFQGTKLIKANASFALAFGYRDPAELEEAGGVNALFTEKGIDLAKTLAEADTSEGHKADLKAMTRSGRLVTIPVAVHPVASDTEEPARLIVLHPKPGNDASDVATRLKLKGQAKSGQQPEDGQAMSSADNPANGDAKKKKKKPQKKSGRRKKASGEKDTGATDFLAKVSHELRTPLNSIIGFAELMKDEQLGPVGNERYRGYIRDIHDSGLYALSLINDLLDISKIKSGEFELNFTAVDLEEVITESVQSMQPQAQRRRVLLRTSFADDLPPVLADRRSVRQIILNLVSNAIKFTLPGGQVIVSVLMTEKSAVRIRVRDTGIGMSKNEVAVAMKPFKQVDAAPKSQIGTGLGLPLTKALVEANRARFKVRSASGTGTRVDVTFPKDRVADPRG